MAYYKLGRSEHEVNMKIKDILTEREMHEVLGETATAGATSAGNIAAVANPPSAHFKSKKRGKYGAPEAPQKKNPDGTAKNALDVDNNLMGGKIVKR